MNAFADFLLSLLLGWLKGLTQFLWDFFSGGGSNGFLPWLGDHWKGLVVILCAVGSGMDLAVRLRNRRALKAAAGSREAPSAAGENSGEVWGFDQGFEDSLDMKSLAFPEEAEKDRRAVFPQAERRPIRDRTEKAFYPVQAAYEVREEGFVPEADGFGDLPGEEVPAETAEKDTRRRRSDKHDSRERRRLFHRVNSLINADEQDDVLLDGLPPVIDKKEAFHKPVYPK